MKYSREGHEQKGRAENEDPAVDESNKNCRFRGVGD
jgi:hypothetical protein